MKKPIDLPRVRRGERGFSLIELMIGVTLGLVVLAALTTFFVSTSSNRHEIERTSRQIENGRFAIDALRNEVHLAGFYAELPQTGATWQVPDPCATDLASLGWVVGPPAQIPVPISGYAADAAMPACLADIVKGTDVLVVRRFHTEPSATPGLVPTQFYFQPSRCRTDSTTKPWVIDQGQNTGNFDLLRVNCVDLAPSYRYRVQIYYIRDYSLSFGDNIPTLVRLELDQGAMSVVPLVEGIQDMRLEYGLDNNLDGTPDGYSRCDAKSPCDANTWALVTAVRAHLLAVNLEETAGHKDAKVYDMGSGDPRTVGPFGDRFKRHIYAAVISAPNRTGPRE